MKYTKEIIKQLADDWFDFTQELHKFTNELAKLVCYSYSSIPDIDDLIYFKNIKDDIWEMYFTIGFEDKRYETYHYSFPVYFFIEDDIVGAANYLIEKRKKEEEDKRIAEDKRKQEQKDQLEKDRYNQYLKLKEEFENKNGRIN